ncbi:protein of unknown function [Acidithiobacillus ferrivorans]|uniref:Uncharacterized protein n=1 Tax=Acidithiobacillus ferrivorans TaxID=160808 RepID=A0A060UZL8_9PROT|nr:hypothetical protein AFERRI_600115 [Acidithiobacillus ferrivorans]SMH65442.1 protein of unknown function [Acidithiobacillus ferrivorans]
MVHGSSPCGPTNETISYIFSVDNPLLLGYIFGTVLNLDGGGLSYGHDSQKPGGNLESGDSQAGLADGRENVPDQTGCRRLVPSD